MKYLLAGTIALVAFASANVARAADMPVKALLTPAPVYSWTGLYVGGDLGGAWTSNTATWTPLPLGPYPSDREFRYKFHLGEQRRFQFSRRSTRWL